MPTTETNARLPADRRLRLLVVDDDPCTLMLLRDALEMLGASVHVSASAREAVQALATFRPHVLISDIGMPIEDGYQLIGRVRSGEQTGCRTPAIACTGHTEPDDRGRAFGAGFDMLVAKPVDLGVLCDAIAHLTDDRGFDGRGCSALASDSDASAPDAGGGDVRSRSAPDS
jgi:CheY-like chemotaxis protein